MWAFVPSLMHVSFLVKQSQVQQHMVHICYTKNTKDIGCRPHRALSFGLQCYVWVSEWTMQCIHGTYQTGPEYCKGSRDQSGAHCRQCTKLVQGICCRLLLVQVQGTHCWLHLGWSQVYAASHTPGQYRAHAGLRCTLLGALRSGLGCTLRCGTRGRFVGAIATPQNLP